MTAVFAVSCGLWSFGYTALRVGGQDIELFSKTVDIHVAQWLLFWVVSSLVSFLLEIPDDPSPKNLNDLLLAMTTTNIFTTNNAWQLFLNLAPLIVVSQPNRVGFRAAV